MGISVSGHKLRISLAIPLPYKYRGGGVAVFRISRGRPEVLLGLRANNPGQGTWSFPGGGAERKERLMTAAVREFKEETGIQLYRRYITKTGTFQIRSLFFEWITIIIESTQDIAIGKVFKNSWTSGGEYGGGEFLSLRWVPVANIGDYKLHCWVKNVIDFYLSEKMEPYTPKPSKNELKAAPVPKRKNRVKTVRRETGECLLFDMAEMVLTRVDRDGTKYFQPKYQTSGK
jgi:8-oxo-dGTP pyrophosphatase MutT (NUDIX family)